MEFFNNQQLGHQAHKGSAISCGLTRGESTGARSQLPPGPGAAAPHSPGPQRLRGHLARPPLPSHQKGRHSPGGSLAAPSSQSGLSSKFIFLIKTQRWCSRAPAATVGGPAWGRAAGTRTLPRHSGCSSLRRAKVSSSGGKDQRSDPTGPVYPRTSWVGHALGHALANDLEQGTHLSPL